MIGKPPKIVIPGMSRGAGIPAGCIVGRRRGTGQGPAELLDLKHLLGMGIATTENTNATNSTTASTAHSETQSLSSSVSTSLSQISSSLSSTTSQVTSLSTAVSTVISGSISAVNSAISSLSTAVGAGGGVDDDSALSTSLSSAVSINTTQSTSLSQISSSLSGAISSTSSLSVAVSTTDSSNLSTAEAYTDAAVAAIAGGGTGTPANGVVSGLGVSYVSGLTFSMTAGSANINGVLVTASAQTTTLATADATNPRIDVLYVDDTGTFGHITGTPSTNPSQPTVDPTSQLYLAFALVPATATSLSGFTTETIYDEGSAGEWTGSTSGSGFTIGSTNNPNTGTKDIEGTSVVAGAYAKFVDGTPTTFDGDGSLLLSIRSKATWNSKRSLVLQWFDAGVAKGVPVTLKEGSFGFSSSNTSSYQALVIAKSLFAVPAGTTKDEFRITAAGSGGTFGFYIDPIKLQTVTSGSGGSGGGGTTTGITQDQADARYEQLSNFNSYSTVVSATDSGQTVSLSQISSSLSGAISSTSSLSTAVSTVVSGSISTVNSEIASLSTAISLLRLVAFFFTTTPSSSEVLALYSAVDAFTIPANMAGSQVKVGTNATSTFAIDVQQNGSSIGTISIGTSGTATLTTASGTSKSIAVGDVLKFVAPSSTDTTIANVAVNIKGTL